MYGSSQSTSLVWCLGYNSSSTDEDDDGGNGGGNGNGNGNGMPAIVVIISWYSATVNFSNASAAANIMWG